MSDTRLHSIEYAQYALSKQVPAMERGFCLSTEYGNLYIAQEEAAPFIKAAENVMKARIKAAEKDGN